MLTKEQKKFYKTAKLLPGKGESLNEWFKRLKEYFKPGLEELRESNEKELGEVTGLPNISMKIQIVSLGNLEDFSKIYDELKKESC